MLLDDRELTVEQLAGERHPIESGRRDGDTFQHMTRGSLVFLMMVVGCGQESRQPGSASKGSAVAGSTEGSAAPELAQWIAAITDLDEASAPSIDRAVKAAEAIAETRSSAGIPALIGIAHRPVTKKLVSAQTAAIRALGKLSEDKTRVVAALTQIISREPPPNPLYSMDGSSRSKEPPAVERFELALAVTGASLDALAELRAEAATGALVRAMYLFPDLFPQVQRALVASGPATAGELRKILRGEHEAVNQLFRTRRLDQYCGGDFGLRCEQVSAKDFYAAVALGGFYDASAVPDLLAALKRPAERAYFIPRPETRSLTNGPWQHVAILETLRKIGSPDAAAAMRALWSDRQWDFEIRAAAINAYAYVTRDSAVAEELGKRAMDDTTDIELRVVAGATHARLSRESRSIAMQQAIASRLFEEGARTAKEVDRAKPRAEKVHQELESAKRVLEAAKEDLLAKTKDQRRSVEQIRDGVKAVRKAEDDLRMAAMKVRPFQALERFAKAAPGFARGFQRNIAQIDLAIRCKEDLACFAASLQLTPDEAIKGLVPYVKDVLAWTAEDKRDLVVAVGERAALEIARRGARAQEHTGALLDQVTTEHNVLRQSILFALPKIAKVPCAACVEKLDLAVKSGEGKPGLSELTLETALLRNYFVWAGAK
jgi:hypothetical protein